MKLDGIYWCITQEANGINLRDCQKYLIPFACLDIKEIQ